MIIDETVEVYYKELYYYFIQFVIKCCIIFIIKTYYANRQNKLVWLNAYFWQYIILVQFLI